MILPPQFYTAQDIQAEVVGIQMETADISAGITDFGPRMSLLYEIDMILEQIEALKQQQGP